MDRAAADIERFTEDMDEGIYAAAPQTQAAVERKFEIIGEALNKLRKTCPELAERIPLLREIVDFRNLLIHDYARVKPDLVDLPPREAMPEPPRFDRCWPP